MDAIGGGYVSARSMYITWYRRPILVRNCARKLCILVDDRRMLQTYTSRQNVCHVRIYNDDFTPGFLDWKDPRFHISVDCGPTNLHFFWICSNFRKCLSNLKLVFHLRFSVRKRELSAWIVSSRFFKWASIHHWHKILFFLYFKLMELIFKNDLLPFFTNHNLANISGKNTSNLQ